MSGRDGYGDFGGALAHIRESGDELSRKGGQGAVSKKVHAELSDRAIGATVAVLLLVSLTSLMSDYAMPVIGICVVLAALLGFYALRSKTRIENSREMQFRAYADNKSQEDKNA